MWQGLRAVNSALAWGYTMSDYIRPRVGGASIFFTVTLAERGSDLLVREVGALREAVRETRAAHPFRIEAWVVMPDHLHAVWTLPEGDTGYSTRWGAIKARFSKAVCRAGFTPPARYPTVMSGRYAGVNPGVRADKGEVAIWTRRFWEHHIRDERDFWAHVGAVAQIGF
jgi:putative transposase